MIMSKDEKLNYLQGVDQEVVSGDGEEEVQVSLNAIQGNDGRATMKYVGSYGEHKLQFQIDYDTQYIEAKLDNMPKMMSSHIATILRQNSLGTLQNKKYLKTYIESILLQFSI